MSGPRQRNTQTPSARAVPPDDEPRLIAIPKEESEDGDGEPQPPRPPRSQPAASGRAKTERIGDTLREARLRHSGNLNEIAEYLCIKPNFLVALENSAYDKLPADAYVIGFLRTYANFLGLDGKEAVDRYRYEMAGRRKKPTLAMPTPLTEGHMPSGIIMVGVTVAVLLIYALWYGVSSSNRAEVVATPTLPTIAAPVSGTDAAAGLTAPVSSSPETPPQAVAPTTPAPQPASTAPATSGSLTIPPEAPGIVVSGVPQAAAPLNAKELAAEAVKSEKAAAKAEAAKAEVTKAEAAAQEAAKKKSSTSGRVVIRAVQSSWVMVTDADGKAIFDGVLKPGETFNVPDRPGLNLTTGNGNGIVLSLNGNELPKIASGAPRVVRNISLDPDRLAAGAAQ